MAIFTCFRRARTWILERVRHVVRTRSPAHLFQFSFVVVFFGAGLGFGQADFRRGDVNVDGVMDIADVEFLVRFFFKAELSLLAGTLSTLMTLALQLQQTLAPLSIICSSAAQLRRPQVRSFQGPIRRRTRYPAPLTTPNLPSRKLTSR